MPTINSPKHYQDTKLMDLLIEKQVPFAEGNVIKYLYRWREKDGLKDLYKARDYLNAIIAHEELAATTSLSTASNYPELYNKRATDRAESYQELSENVQQTLSIHKDY